MEEETEKTENDGIVTDKALKMSEKICNTIFTINRFKTWP